MRIQSLISKLVFLVFAGLVANQLACSNASFGAKDSTGKGNNIKQTDTGLSGEQGNPFTQTTNTVDLVQITNGTETISWTVNPIKNFSVYYSQNCIKGLATNADDPVVKSRSDELNILISTSTVGVGRLSQPGVNSIYLTVRYDNGLTRKFNLRNASASTSEQTLSKGSQIISFFDRVYEEIRIRGYVSCNNGKK